MMQIPPPQRKFMSGPRRVASVPVRLAGTRNTPSPSASMEHYGSATTPGGSVQNNIDLLFAHSSARIVSFSTVTPVQGELLPWTSPTERTIASGPIRIYKTIPHDIAFLQSGSALRPVLSKSQCWNVDSRGTFCLQIRPGSFWRLEILEPEDHEAVKAIEFRGVLVKILAYEVTTCPFQRTGDICVREAEILGILQPSKVWRRPRRTESVDLRAVEEALVGEEKRVVEEEEEEVDVFGGLESALKSAELEKTATTPGDVVSWEDFTPRTEVLSSSVDSVEWQGFMTPRSFGVSRSCTAPPQLTDANAFSTISTPSSCTSTPCPSTPASPTKWHVPSQLPQETRIAKRRDRASSLMSVETESTACTELSQDSPTPSTASTPTLWSGSDCQSEDNWSETATTPPRPTPRLFDPISTTSKPRLTRSASSIMLSKTANLANMVVIKPSSYIAGLMFSIAAKIASRAVTGAAYSLTERMYSTGLAITGLDDEEVFEYEDDYGVCLKPGTRVGAWEGDQWGVE